MALQPGARCLLPRAFLDIGFGAFKESLLLQMKAVGATAIDAPVSGGTGALAQDCSRP
jgi:hypothetical protein